MNEIFRFDNPKLHGIILIVYHVLRFDKDRENHHDAQYANSYQKGRLQRLGKSVNTKRDDAVYANAYSCQGEKEDGYGEGNQRLGKLIFEIFCLFRRIFLFHIVIIARVKKKINLNRPNLLKFHAKYSIIKR